MKEKNTATSQIGRSCDPDPKLMEQYANKILALEEKNRPVGVGLAILDDLDKQLSEGLAFGEKLLRKPKAKGSGRLDERRKTAIAVRHFHAKFRERLLEFDKAVEEIADDRLRYEILFHSRNMATTARILGNIARRNAFEERRDKINGGKRKTNQNQKTKQRQLKVEKKVQAILRATPMAELDQVWKKVHRDGSMRNLATRNTLAKDVLLAWQKRSIEPPR
jgi:hypothetical protein